MTLQNTKRRQVLPSNNIQFKKTKRGGKRKLEVLGGVLSIQKKFLEYIFGIQVSSMAHQRFPS